jgi:hypothetical protein
VLLYVIENQTSTSTSGTSSSASTSSLNPSQNHTTPKSTLSYAEFRKRMQVAQTKKVKSAKKAKTINEEVKVQVGVLEADGGKLKRLKGRTLPLVITCCCNANDLLQAAIDKQTKHFKQFNKHAAYFILYPDYSIVHKLPGSSEDFILNDYKKDLGKPYSKIHFYLCDKLDFEKVQDFADTDSDDERLMPAGEVKKEVVSLESAISISDNDEKTTSFRVPTTSCPTCFEMFPFDQIELHANVCADNLIDPIGNVSDDDLEELLQQDSPEECTVKGDVDYSNPDTKMEKMK